MIRHNSLRRPLSAVLAGACLVWLGLSAFPAQAELQVNVTSGVTDPVPIAIVPFARAVPADGGLDVAQVVQHDLEGSGRFRAMARAQMPATPTQPGAVTFADWKNAGEDYMVIGRVLPL